MRNLNLLSMISSSSIENGSTMTRKRSENGSTTVRFSLASLICILMLTLGVGNAWGADTNVTINFGTTTGYWKAHDNDSYTDSDSRTWSRTFSAGGKKSGQAGYSQFGNSDNACTSLVLTATAGSAITLKTFSVTMAGASANTAGTIYLYKRTSGGVETQLATASVSGTSSVICSMGSNTAFAATDILKVSYVGTAKAIRISTLTYSYAAAASGYTITYNANGGTGSMSNTTGATVNAAANGFTAPVGKYFTGWNTAANGSGTSYAAGASVNATVTLYAQWAAIWQLRGDFNSWGTTDPLTTYSDGVATITKTLNAMTKYEFKMYNVQESAYYKNTGKIITDISGWDYSSGDGANTCLYTGPAGTYTFKFTLAGRLLQVIYPSVSHPSAGYAYFQQQGGWSACRIYQWDTGGGELTTWENALTVSNTANICGTTYYYFALANEYNSVKFRDNGVNQGNELAISGYSGKFTGNNFSSPAWNAFTNYTITFAGNGNTGGSMSNVSSICPSSDVVLASNGYTKTDYDFAGWKTNTAVTINGSTPIAVNGIIPNGATINSVSSNITLTAQWQRDEDQFIDILQNTSGYTEASPHIEFGSYSTPTIPDKSVATSGTCQQQHYHFVGWITAAKYAAGTAISDGDLQTPTTASNATYYAVWAKQAAGGGSGTVSADLATLKAAVSSISSGYSSKTFEMSDGVNSYTITADVTKSTNGTTSGWMQVGRNSDSRKITITDALPGAITNISASSIYNASGSTYSGTIYYNNTASTTDPIASKTLSSASSFSMEVSNGETAGYIILSNPMCLGDLSITYSSISYTDYKAICCTDWSTPTVTYTSPLAIGGTASVSIGSGTTHGAVTYESSDEDVLTVAADGTVTAVGAGTAHVIATWAGDATYCEKSANSNDISVSGILVTGTTPVNFGQVYQNAVVANKTISVTGVNLASAITPSLPAGSPFSFSSASLPANSSGATLTISASTATLGNYNQTLTLTSGAFSTTVTVKMEVIAMPSCEFVDNLHNLTVDASSVTLSSYNLTAAQGTAVVFPTLANQTKGTSTCEDQHYRFVGWTTSDNNTDPEDHLVTSHTLANGDDITYYAVWADGVEGVTYTKLTSSTFKTSPTKYVLGAVHPDNGTIYYLYSCSQTDKNNSWGYCSSDPSEDAPIQFTLSGSAAALVATSTEVTSRYLKDLADKDFQLSASSKDVELKSDGTIYNNNTGETSYRLLFNKAGSGLRWYSSNVSGSSNAFFYEVGAGSVVHYRTSCCANKVEAPTVTATKTSTSITLTWGDETGATGWEVSWNGGAFGSPSGTRTHTVSGLTPNTTYTWQVRATYDPLVKCGADIASGSTTTNQVYHVTYAKGDGEANCSATGTTTDATGYEAGATVTLQANGFTLVGHIFAGWTEDDDDITISSNQFTMPDHDVVITASWTAKVDKYFDRMHDQTDALHGGVEETEGTNEGKYYIAKTGCNYSIPTAVDSNTGDACQTTHYKLQGWIASSYVASDGTITPANLSAHLFPPSGTKTATGATYYAVWAEVTE